MRSSQRGSAGKSALWKDLTPLGESDFYRATESRKLERLNININVNFSCNFTLASSTL